MIFLLNIEILIPSFAFSFWLNSLMELPISLLLDAQANRKIFAIWILLLNISPQIFLGLAHTDGFLELIRLWTSICAQAISFFGSIPEVEHSRMREGVLLGLKTWWNINGFPYILKLPLLIFRALLPLG